MEFKFDIPSKAEFIKMANEAEHGKTLLGFPILKQDILNCDIRQATKFFENIVASKSAFKNSVMLSISGYDDDRRELFEIDEVRLYIQKLLKRIPYLLYYVHLDECFGWIMACYSDTITTVRPINQQNMTAQEAVYRRFVLGEDVTQPLKISLKSDKVRALTNSLRLLGAKVKDTEYASEVVDKIHNSLI